MVKQARQRFDVLTGTQDIRKRDFTESKIDTFLFTVRKDHAR
jgi:hypothetical protein